MWGVRGVEDEERGGVTIPSNSSIERCKLEG